MSNEQSGAVLKQVEMTVGIVKAYVSANAVPASDLPKLLNDTFMAVGKLGDQPVPASQPVLTPKVAVGKSIQPDYLVCLDDGLKFKSLKPHLRSLGMTPDEYRAKWGLPASYPMVAPSYSVARRDLAIAMGLGQSRVTPLGDQDHSEYVSEDEPLAL